MASFDAVSINQFDTVTPHASSVTVPPVSAGVVLVDPSNPVCPPVAAARRFTPSLPANRNIRRLSSVCNLGVGSDFFEDIYVLPPSIDAGIILTVLVFDIEVYSSYRSGKVQFTSYDDSAAGAGVDLATASPPPPTINIGPQSNSTHVLTIQPDGPPSIAANLVFDFLTPSSAAEQRLVPLRGQRSVVFPFEPERPIKETLEWVTQVLTSASGEEQRIALREVPRSTLQLRFLTEDDDRRRLENLVFDSQAQAFGLPIWYEATDLSVAIAVNDTTITVVDTTFSNLVNDGLAIVWDGSTNFEALQVDSFTSTTITFKSPFTQVFSPGALVMPMRVSQTTKPVSQRRYRVNLQEDVIDFIVADNGSTLADTSAFSSYQPTNGTLRVLLDDENFVPGQTIQEEFRRAINVLDNRTAAPKVSTDQVVSREATQKGWFTQNRQKLKDVRSLLHALRGRQVSFYLPSFFPDLEVISNVSAADQAITVRDVDYVNLVQQRQPRNVIRLVKTDGTKSDPKVVTGSSKPQPDEESISIATDTIGVTATVSEIERLEYVKKSRFDSDRIGIEHIDSAGRAKILVPVIPVLEAD